MFVLPIGSTSVVSRRPWVTIGLAVSCVLVFAATALENKHSQGNLVELEQELQERPWLMDSSSPPADLSPEQVAEERMEFRRRAAVSLDASGGLERRLSLVPARGFAQAGWFTNLFIHFDIFHLLGNLLFLWMVGPLLEEAWGRRRFAAFYLLAGLVASLAQFALSTKSVSSIGGASGAIAGCMGAFAVRFASERIQFGYFFWILRPVWGTFTTPAWVAGLFWFGRELFDLKAGGANGVATGAHVGGFVLGSALALTLKALGWERSFMTVTESHEEEESLASLYRDAAAAHRMGDSDTAQERLQRLLAHRPGHRDAEMMLAEIEVRHRRGAGRFEKLMRPRLARDNEPVESVIMPLWDHLETLPLTDGFLWELSERLGARKNLKHHDFHTSVLRKLGAGTGRYAMTARKMLSERRGPELELESSSAPSVLAQRTITGESAVPAFEPVVMLAQFESMSNEGLFVVVGGRKRSVPFSAIRSIEAAVVPAGQRSELLVDLVLVTPPSRPPAALRLSGEDAGVLALYPGTAVPNAWSNFIGVLRKRIVPADTRPVWEHLASGAQLTRGWSRSGS